ncbi:HlyD family efflux transporter periplasmic adaptor subunit [Geitlerinema sp. P-1104]|uniref:HlyD family efflux transporter periplasmic adaptor subunit n=1 Tax=Geitlerinema sp. P-1104 TaxID=2546230 RepID=UPI00147773A3|nr:HlyD family efflux transporter periplasmic adaptor subunit [Geitlerinema sp. P-1104]NMG57247.1 HlyD family efflux transporter periplasmic adaptor subunit [Geitlerinema sp. P-1104]
MTSQPQQPQSPLRVVPPTPDAPNPDPSPAPSPPQPEANQPATTTKPETQQSGQGWLKIGAVVIVLGAVGFIPTGSRVVADAIIQDSENARQRVTMPRSADGPVEFHIDSGDSVKLGDQLVTITNRQLRDRIREAEQNIERGQGQLRQAEIELNRARRERDSAREKEEQAERRLERKNLELQRLIDGSAPGSQRLQEDGLSIESERAAIDAQIHGLEFQIGGLEDQWHTLESHLSELKIELERVSQRAAELEQLRNDGGMARHDSQLNDALQEQYRLRQELSNGEGEQRQINSQILRIESEVSNLENKSQGLGHKREAMEHQRRALIETNEQEQQDLADRYYQQQNERRILDSSVERAIQNVENNQADLLALENELENLTTQEQEYTITATTNGVVITDDIDLLHNQSFAPGAELLHIANPRTLQVVAYVSQGDQHLIQDDQPIKFRLQGQPDFSREGIIESKGQHFKPGELQPVLKVTFTIDNPEDASLIGAEGYVSIDIGKRNLYQKMHHQFSKLIDLPRYFSWPSRE